MPNQSVPLTERKYVVPFVLVTSLFFLWAIGVNLNDVLIPHLKKAFGLTDFQSSFIQVAFFGGYFLGALPAGRLMEKIGYKGGILTGLLICASGAFLFIPASIIGAYGFFLLALFVMSSGQSFLEVGANPYVTVLGPPESSATRLNFAQSFNAVGAVVTPFLGALFILSGIEYSPAQLAAMSPAQLAAYRLHEASMVRGPYLVITGIFVLVAAMIYFSRLPEVAGPGSGESSEGSADSLQSVWAHPHLIKGVIAQFFYVGAQVGVGSFVIRFVKHTMPDTPEKMAAQFLVGHQVGFMIGRFLGSAIMKRVPAPRLLAVFGVGALACVAIGIATSGLVSVIAIVLVGFFNSIMFPTIFALSLKNLGGLTKRGSSLLVMSIIGGGLIPPVMGRISDVTNIQLAFLVPLICYIYVIYFATMGYKPKPVASLQPAAAASEAKG
jgi:FHS family L-fucose permease-like MFS transporter